MKKLQLSVEQKELLLLYMLDQHSLVSIGSIAGMRKMSFHEKNIYKSLSPNPHRAIPGSLFPADPLIGSNKSQKRRKIPEKSQPAVRRFP